MRYLYSGEVSISPAELRTAKYSNLSDIWYFTADRYPDQCDQSCVSFNGAKRSWNGVVKTIGEIVDDYWTSAQ